MGLTLMGKNKLEVKGYCDASNNSHSMTKTSMINFVTTEFMGEFRSLFAQHEILH